MDWKESEVDRHRDAQPYNPLFPLRPVSLGNLNIPWDFDRLHKLSVYQWRNIKYYDLVLPISTNALFSLVCFSHHPWWIVLPVPKH